MSSIEPCLLLPGLRMTKTAFFMRNASVYMKLQLSKTCGFDTSIRFPVAAERRLNKVYLFFWSNRGYQARFIIVKLWFIEKAISQYSESVTFKTKSFCKVWVSKLAESDKGSYYKQEKWLKDESFWKTHWNYREIEFHEFLSERSELFRSRSDQASDKFATGPAPYTNRTFESLL